MVSWSEPTRHIQRQAEASALQAQIRREDEAHVAAERAQRNHETVFLLGVAATMAAVVAIGVQTVNFNRAYAKEHAPAIAQFQPSVANADTPAVVLNP